MNFWGMHFFVLFFLWSATKTFSERQPKTNDFFGNGIKYSIVFMSLKKFRGKGAFHLKLKWMNGWRQTPYNETLNVHISSVH